MGTARRLGAFSLILAFLLYLFHQNAPADLAWRDQVIPYIYIFGALGLYLVFTFWERSPKRERASGCMSLLFGGPKKPPKTKQKKEKKKRGKKNKNKEQS
jgi:hypothetical protein